MSEKMQGARWLLVVAFIGFPVLGASAFGAARLISDGAPPWWMGAIGGVVYAAYLTARGIWAGSQKKTHESRGDGHPVVDTPGTAR